nr:unnamed protein product [Digitaria exilis]
MHLFEAIHAHRLLAVGGGVVGATAEAGATGILKKPNDRSRSISGSPRGGRRDRDERRSRSLSYSRSPRRSASPSAKEKERSPTPNGSRSPSPRDQLSPLPKDNGERNGSERGDSPVRREDSRSRSRSPSDGYRSPAANGRSLSPRDDRSPSPKGNAGDEDGRGSPRGSQSP